MKLPVRIVVAALLLGLMPLSLSAQRLTRRVCAVDPMLNPDPGANPAVDRP